MTTEMMDEIDDYTTMQDKHDEIAEGFVESQELNTGTHHLQREPQEYTANTHNFSGGDLDAAWPEAGGSEETVDSLVTRLDPHGVDKRHKAMGLTYADDSSLRIANKLEEGARHYWR